MVDGDAGCGPVHAIYTAARSDDTEAVRRAWAEHRSAVRAIDGALADVLERAMSEDDLEAVARRADEYLFGEDATVTLDGLVARVIGRLLHGFGYLASFVLFARAHRQQTVVRRLRWAYRRVGVDIRFTETVDGVERTVFRCPYRTVAADRYGERRVCHDVLDRVDDGYVTFLARHRGLDYQRPRACTGSPCCYSEVTER